MHPIEHLRYVARSHGAEPGEVALEAAEALAALAFEPRALVLACHRLLDAQPGVAPLWWLSARVLGAANPAQAARDAAQQLASDLTRLELTYGLPSGSVVVMEAPSTVAGSLAERPDFSLRLVGPPGEVHWALRDLAADGGPAPDAAGFDLHELASAMAGATIALVEARAASPTRLLLSRAGAALAPAAAAARAALWVVAPLGRVLPEPLFDACAAGSPGAEVLPASLAGRVAGPAGLLAVDEGLDPGDCSVPASLTARAARR